MKELKLNKHAYLIMAHNNFEQLKILLKLIDYEKNDIYIHIDFKVKDVNFDDLKSCVKKSSVVFVNRVSVKWGDYSQIECEMNLLKEAIKGKYSYYHLISGLDLVIKTQEEIHDFFEKNYGKEFIHFRDDNEYKHVIDRVKLYHFFQDYIKQKNIIKKNFFGIIERTSIIFQKLTRVNRLKKYDVVIKSGANWFSITDNLAKYIVNEEENIEKMYQNTLCADEVFIQTIVYNSNFKNNLFNQSYDNNYLSCMRYIDWKRGRPYTWKINDFDELISSGFMFARKFDFKIDDKIIKKIYSHIKDEIK